jgi:hypothetical protein
MLKMIDSDKNYKIMNKNRAIDCLSYISEEISNINKLAEDIDNSKYDKCIKIIFSRLNNFHFNIMSNNNYQIPTLIINEHQDLNIENSYGFFTLNVYDDKDKFGIHYQLSLYNTINPDSFTYPLFFNNTEEQFNSRNYYKFDKSYDWNVKTLALIVNKQEELNKKLNISCLRIHLYVEPIEDIIILIYKALCIAMYDYYEKKYIFANNSIIPLFNMYSFILERHEHIKHYRYYNPYDEIYLIKNNELTMEFIDYSKNKE